MRMLRNILDRRDYSYSRSFGLISIPVLPNLDYTYDIGITDWNQNAMGWPFACTGFTQADIATDEDKVVYDPIFTYKQTCLIERHDWTRGCSLRNSLKIGTTLGMLPMDANVPKGTELNEAIKNLRGAYYNVDKVDGMDWFDSFRLTLRHSKQPISVGTLWFIEWGDSPNGIMTEDFYFDGKWDTESGHNYKICGEKTINGLPHLIVKPWTGSEWGDKGFGYMSRDCFNKAFDIYGTLAFTQTKATPQEVRQITLTLYQRVLSLLQRIIPLIKVYA